MFAMAMAAIALWQSYIGLCAWRLRGVHVCWVFLAAAFLMMGARRGTAAARLFIRGGWDGWGAWRELLARADEIALPVLITGMTWAAVASMRRPELKYQTR